eukprot:Hpha_TRINITY_DN5546_c0_g1::TRINITY_DN5546_c0_g1_i1::g.93698::m.93698
MSDMCRFFVFAFLAVVTGGIASEGGDEASGAAVALPLPDELSFVSGLKPGGGYVVSAGCNHEHGVNNQRQALAVSILISVALKRPLMLPDYARNTHDRVTQLSMSDLFDIQRLRTALAPIPVSEYQDEGIASAAVVDAPDGFNALNLTELLPRMPSGNTVLRGKNCYGGVQWRLRGHSKQLRAWADEVLRFSLRPARPLTSAASRLASGMRALIPAGSRFHSVHIRTVGKSDFLSYSYPPLVSCPAVNLTSMKCVLPGGCSKPLRSRKVILTSPFADHNFVVYRAIRSGVIRAGDGVFIATNNPRSFRVRWVVSDLREAGVTVWVGGVEAANSTAGGRSTLSDACRSAVQEGVVDLVTASLADGIFFGATSSTFTEHILDIRRWHAREGATEAALLYERKWRESMKCAAGAKKPPREKKPKGKKRPGPYMKMA